MLQALKRGFQGRIGFKVQGLGFTSWSPEITRGLGSLLMKDYTTRAILGL